VPTASGETRSTESQNNQLVARRVFDVGLPVVFGQTSFPSPPRIHPVVSIQHVEKAHDPSKDPFGRYTTTSALQIVDSRISNHHPGKAEYLLRRTWTLTPPSELLADFEERNAFFEAIQAPYTIMDHRTTRQGTRYKVSFGDNRRPRWITDDVIDPHALGAYRRLPQAHVTSPTGQAVRESRSPSRAGSPVLARSSNDRYSI
ncbi:hypothetical protein FN846DRAFT_1000591, partial [Sphaerosporella brunnea]